MLENATVSIYAPTIAANSEGDRIKTWGYKKTPTPDAPAETFRADVQPKQLSDSEREMFGISDRNANTKILFFSQSQYVALNNRAYVVSDFPGEPADYFEIKVPNRWPGHGECLLIPVQGE